MTPIRRHHIDRSPLVRRQHGLVTYPQLLELHLSPDAVRHAVAVGRLHRIYTGVYAVGRPDLTRHGRWLAAVLACGDEAVLSHTPAGLLWGVLERGDERPHVSVPTDGGRTPPAGIRIHRAASLRPEDRVTRQGIPVTSLIRTIIDLGRELEQRAVRAVIRRGEQRGLDVAALRSAVELPRRDPAKARVREALELYVPGPEVHEGLEDPFLALCLRHRIPLPRCQVPIGPYRADFLWPAERLIVETDGATTHGTRVATAEDAIRDRYLTDRGYEVRRYGHAEVTGRPAAVARDLRAALRRRVS